MRRWLAAAALAAAGSGAVLALGADQTARRPPRTDAVLYGIGMSTDPYGRSRPRGAGVAFGIGRVRARTAVVRRRELRPVAWLSDRTAAVVHFDRAGVPRHRLLRVGPGNRLSTAPAGLPPRALTPAWSPDGHRVAHLKAVACRPPAPVQPCYMASRRTFVTQAGGWPAWRMAFAGQARGWTPAGRLVVVRRGSLYALDLRSGRRTLLLSKVAVARRTGARLDGFLDPPIWSPDGRYLAAQAHLPYPDALADGRRGTIVVATARGRIVRVFRSAYAISMLAWSPRGQRLAWTTSGFPDPHELFVAEPVRPGTPRRLMATVRHFDWVTWSPDGRRLLVDDEHDGRGSWRLLDATGRRPARTLARLGGQPLWCCPQNAFVTATGAWSAGVRP